MKQYNVKYSETFYEDLQNITLHIIEKTGSIDLAREFYIRTIRAIEKRSFSADSFEKYIPYDNADTYYRIYFGKYIIFYVLKGNDMDVRRMLWSGIDKPKFF